MKIYSDTKVYILCPGNYNSGGPESVHQLASQLLSLGICTYIHYYPLGEFKFNASDPVQEIYKKYHVPYTFKLDDDPQNILIASETSNEYLYFPKRCRGVLWWLSVGNYFVHIIKQFQFYQNTPLDNPISKFFCFDKCDKNIEHWGQSEYVRQFLNLNGVTKIKAVETHMSQTFLNRLAQIDLKAKKNFVAYNPRKGFEITKKLIDFAPDIEWRPIENMTPAQVQELLTEAKIYIDFGEFPGRERLPREASLSGCVVITGKRGAAANDIDINTPAEFKFDEQITKPQEVIKKIREVFENFSVAYEKQKAFRDKELNAQRNFTTQIIEALEIKNFPPPSVAFVQDVSEKSFLLAEELFKSKEFVPSFIVDDILATAKISDELILREQNRNYLRVGENFIEIITRDDAKFLYWEGRIKKFALLDPTDNELKELKNFYEPATTDILIFRR